MTVLGTEVHRRSHSLRHAVRSPCGAYSWVTSWSTSPGFPSSLTGSCGDRGEMAMAIARLFCPILLSTSDTAFFPLYSFAVVGAAGHNRWGVVESKAGTWTVVSFKPQGETKGLKGTVPRTHCQKGRHNFRAGCSRSARQVVWATTRVPSVAHGAVLHACSRSTNASKGRRPRNRP